MKHVAWYCPICKKFDFVDSEEVLCKPEHIPYRGVDIGSCKGRMIKLYVKVEEYGRALECG